MESLKRNWKTSILGLLIILVVIAYLVQCILEHKPIDLMSILGSVGGLAGGAGLLAAGDANAAPAAGKGGPVPPALLGLLVAGALLSAAPARADDSRPSALCAIGSQGNWCFGVLPTVSGPGVDVRHGTIADGFQVGASLAGTWMPGQLKSVTFGVHAGVGQTDGVNLPRSYNLGGTLSFLKGYATIIVDWQAVGGNHAVVLVPALGIVL